MEVPVGFVLFKSSVVNYSDIEEESDMKNKLCMGLAFLLVMMLTGCEAWEKETAANRAIEKQVKSQVDEVVTAIDGGKKAEDFKKLATDPHDFVLIMDQSGKFLVHPVLESLSQSDKGYMKIVSATTEGIWFEYWSYLHIWKRFYVKKTKGGLFVGSGYYPNVNDRLIRATDDRRGSGAGGERRGKN